jgi:hypothetical protein
MEPFDLESRPILARTVERLAAAAGDRLVSVVLYGPAAHGDHYAEEAFHLMVVLADLELATLARVADPIRRWIGKGQPMPRLFTRELIADAADVFPIEFLDIRSYHVVLHGEDPLAELDVHKDHLRLQCERELREKLMRLVEAYLEAAGSERKLRRLLVESYPTFVAIFRGCLLLESDRAPAHGVDVAEAFCRQADLDPAPFSEVERLEHGERSSGGVEELFGRYYAQLTRAVSAIDRFSPQSGGKDP